MTEAAVGGPYKAAGGEPYGMPVSVANNATTCEEADVETISEKDLQDAMEEIEGLREDAVSRDKYRAPRMTDLQFKILSAAREGEDPVSWPVLAGYWEEKGWGKIGRQALTKRFELEKVRRAAVGMRNAAKCREEEVLRHPGHMLV